MLFKKKKFLEVRKPKFRKADLTKMDIKRDNQGFLSLTPKDSFIKEDKNINSFFQESNNSQFSFFDSVQQNNQTSNQENLFEEIRNKIDDLYKKIYKIEEKIEILEKKLKIRDY